MYVVLGIHGWHIELAGRGPETFIPPTAVHGEAAILMALGGPLAEEKLCGPKGVFHGAIDDIWQVRDGARTLGVEVPNLRPLVARAREILRKHGLAVIEMAEILQKRGRLSEDDVPNVKGG